MNNKRGIVTRNLNLEEIPLSVISPNPSALKPQRPRAVDRNCGIAASGRKAAAVRIPVA